METRGIGGYPPFSFIPYFFEPGTILEGRGLGSKPQFPMSSLSMSLSVLATGIYWIAYYVDVGVRPPVPHVYVTSILNYQAISLVLIFLSSPDSMIFFGGTISNVH